MGLDRLRCTWGGVGRGGEGGYTAMLEGQLEERNEQWTRINCVILGRPDGDIHTAICCTRRKTTVRGGYEKPARARCSGMTSRVWIVSCRIFEYACYVRVTRRMKAQQAFFFFFVL